MYQTLKRRLVNSFLCLNRLFANPNTEIEWQRRLGKYVSTFPTAQNALDIFRGDWASALPSEAELSAGIVPLFEDPKIVWAEQELGGFEGCKILELGPLEGGHTYMLEKRGAASIVAIEANQRAYLKCLIIKDLFGLTKAQFRLGNFMTYLNHAEETFDICVASGVLYHMKNPARLIHLISKRAKRVTIWTHYYDAALLKENPYTSRFHFQEMEYEYQGFKHVLYQQRYRQNFGESLGRTNFFGGDQEFSCWMKREDILACLEFFGFRGIKIAFEELDHPHGPCFCLVGFLEPNR